MIRTLVSFATDRGPWQMLVAARDASRRRDRSIRVALLAVWLIAMVYVAAHHVFWRDEIRAFTIALRGADMVAMLRGLQGEGHPVLWYVMLRAAHALVPVREVLPVVAALVGAASAAVFALRSPFRPAVVALVLCSAFGLFEYVVMARNYGISMLLLFALAAVWPATRAHGWVPGVLLLLLCSSNAPSVMLAGAFLLFWAIDLIACGDWRRVATWRGWAVAAGLTAIGTVACLVAIYPPYNDAAVLPHPGGITAGALAFAFANLAGPMGSLLPDMLLGVRGIGLPLSIAIVGSLFGLVRVPGAFIAATVSLILFVLFFQLVYPGSYRHQALFLVFLVTLYWLAIRGHGGAWRGRPLLREGTRTLLQQGGVGCFVALLALQVPDGLASIAYAAWGPPYSSARDLGALLHRPGLADAIVVANPDTIVEPLAYYAPNPTWLMREHRFGRVVHFSYHVQLDLDLGDVLTTAQALHRRTGHPVVIALWRKLDATAPASTFTDGYAGTMTMTPAQVRAFQAATRLIASLRPAQTDENYDVYQLR